MAVGPTPLHDNTPKKQEPASYPLEAGSYPIMTTARCRLSLVEDEEHKLLHQI